MNPPEARLPESQGAGSRGRMLVVDDDPRSRRLLESYLLAEGYDVMTAEGGQQGLDRIREQLPDVVLLDVMMPGMTGYQVCEQIKSEPRTRMCQVMLVTALDSTPEKVEGLDVGADDYLAKPVRRDEFLAKVRALMRVRELLGDLQSAKEELANRNEELQLKKTLAQSLVHDLKSPLAAILGNLDLLESRQAEGLEKMIARSKTGAQRMLKMILNLLDVEGLEQGQLTPTVERCDLNAILTAVMEEAQVGAIQQEVRLEKSADIPLMVVLDPVLIRRVFDNLMANAVTHSPRGGTVTIDIQPGRDELQVSVTDDGSGVPEDFREMVFEKYAQLDARRSGVSNNRGLGLTFCRLAVLAHGGQVRVDPTDGRGARFVVTLPTCLPVPAALTHETLFSRN
ncbi:MAG: hybrid sensor histidine kinase/response regulator [Acidobacteriota bacterium]|nr:hybrid sensor histidine kinase/response regulator [Acidobacteriota bacterium]